MSKPAVEVKSPFLEIPEEAWIASNELAFAVRDSFPVSAGHTLVVPRRVAPDWFHASREEQSAIIDLVSEVKGILDRQLSPAPDGYKAGFDAGGCAEV